MIYKDIYEFVRAKEKEMAVPISVIDGWDWNFRDHVRLSILYKNSQFSQGNTQSQRDFRPFRNIVKPLLNLQYRIEDIELKDVQLYVDEPSRYHLSFLIKKYHDDVFATENNLDDFFDELNESKVDLGGALTKQLPNQACPEVVPLQSIAFCDQTNLLGGPIGIKHFYSPDELREMEKLGWGNKANGATTTIEEVIVLSEEKKSKELERNTPVKTPGKYIEVYEVHGVLPADFLDGKPNEYIGQMQIVCFYKDNNENQVGLTLFAGKEKKLPFKFLARDKIYGRALGMGAIEELFDAQVWTNYAEARIKEFLDAASKVILQTSDVAYAGRNRIADMENLEVTVTEEGKELRQVPTTPVNISLFERSVQEWQTYAQFMSGGSDALLGKTPRSGTAARVQERVVLEGKALASYRKGKLAKHIEGIYRDWIIPYIAKQITKGTKFLSELDPAELQSIGKIISENQANRIRNEQVLNGELPSDKEELKQKAFEDFMKGGSKKYIEILKDELKDAPIKVKISIAGKQKDLSGMVSSLIGIIKQVLSAPQILQNPQMVTLFNQILEGSGFSPIEFGIDKLIAPAAAPAVAMPAPAAEPAMSV